MAKLSDIKRLYDAGFSIIYLHEKQKRPIGNDWTKLPNKTWAELKAAYNPKFNVGVRLGEWSKIKGKGYLACIDVDIKDPKYKAEALAKLKEITEDNDFPTVMSGSGNGSRHLYCVSDKPFKQIEIAKHKGKWEIVVYSSGRQTVLPPSVHPDTGAEYKWRAEFTGELPAFNVQDLQAGKDETDEEIELDFKAVDVNLYDSTMPLPMIKQIETGNGVGDRSAFLFSVALMMCRLSFSDNQILSVLSDPDHWISEAGYEHTQSRSRKRAVQWLSKYTLRKARYETHIMRRFEDKPETRPLDKEEAEVEEAENLELSGKILPDLDQKGKPKPTLKNLIHVLEVFFEPGLVGFDEFKMRSIFLKDTIYGGMKGKEITDKDDLALKVYVSKHFRFEPSKELCYEAHAWVAHQYAFHPVKMYLESLEWDGIPRIDTWLKRSMQAVAGEPFLTEASHKVLVAAVNRIYNPGCKYDYMVVLEGAQGKGKSLSLRCLASDNWFTDSLGDIYQKDVVDQMSGKWLIEFSELASLKGKDLETTKSFITRQVDRVRLPYGRRSEDFPRQSVFIGTTNENEYLNDPSGDRRFWPISIHDINIKWIKRFRDQLWAEAMHCHQNGEGEDSLRLSKEAEVIAKVEQEKRFQVDEWEGHIKAMFANNEIKRITGTEVFRKISGAFEGHPSDADAKRIGKIMRRMGYVRKNLKLDGVQTRMWAKPQLATRDTG